MIARIEIDGSDATSFEYQVTFEGEALFGDGGFTSVMHCLVAAVEGLSPDIRAVEVAYRGIVSGTYPLEVLAINHEQIAAHAANTTTAVLEALS